MSAFAIAVFQTTATVAINDNNAPVSSQPFVQVLNVVVETDTHILSLIRYVPDLLEFDTLVYIYTHYLHVIHTHLYTFIIDQDTLSSRQDSFSSSFRNIQSRQTT